MRLRLPQHLKHMTISSILLLGTAGALASTTSLITGTSGLPLGTSAACGCKVAGFLKAKRNSGEGTEKECVFHKVGDACVVEISNPVGANVEIKKLTLEPVAPAEFAYVGGQPAECKATLQLGAPPPVGTEKECFVKIEFVGAAAAVTGAFRISGEAVGGGNPTGTAVVLKKE